MRTFLSRVPVRDVGRQAAFRGLGRRHDRHGRPSLSTALENLAKGKWDKDSIPLIVAQLDKLMLKAAPKPDKNAPQDDLLFDIIMTRFEVMRPYRSGLVAIADQARRDPDLALILYKALDRTAALFQTYAYQKPFVHKEKINRALILGLYGFVFLKWACDDSPDLSETMVNLNAYKNVTKVNFLKKTSF